MLRTVNISRLRSHVKDALSHVKRNKKPLIITERGVASSVLLDIDSYEDLLSSKDKKFLNSIRKARGEYRSGEFLKMEDVFENVV